MPARFLFPISSRVRQHFSRRREVRGCLKRQQNKKKKERVGEPESLGGKYNSSEAVLTQLSWLAFLRCCS